MKKMMKTLKNCKIKIFKNAYLLNKLMMIDKINF